MITEPFITEKLKGVEWLFRDSSPFSVFIPENLSPEQVTFRDNVANFYRKEIEPHISRLENLDFSLLKKLLKKMADKGFLNPSIPTEYNGGGMDLISSSLVSFCASAYTSFGVTQSAHSGIGSIPVLYFGNEEQKRRFLPKLASGEYIAAYGLTEPGSGSDALSAKTTAVLSGDGNYYVLDGQKCWITNGGIADLFTIFAKVDGKHFTAFLVEKGTKGFTIGPEEHKMGLKGSSTVQLYFQDCRIPSENLLGEVGKGHVIALNTLNSGRFTLGFMSLGICHHIFGQICDYLKNHPNESLKLKFQAICSKMAELDTLYFVLESGLFRTEKMIENKETSYLLRGTDENESYLNAREEFVVEAAIIKVYATEVLRHFGDEFIQILELDGYNEAFSAARAYRDNRVTLIFEGTNEINRLLLIEMLLKNTGHGRKLIEVAERLLDDSASFNKDPLFANEFQKDQSLVGAFKNMFILLIAAAIKHWKDDFRQQQEVTLQLADLLIATYFSETALLRTFKIENVYGPEAASIPVLKTKNYIAGTADKFYVNGRSILATLDPSEENKRIKKLLEKICTSYIFNSKSAKRVIANEILSDFIPGD